MADVKVASTGVDHLADTLDQAGDKLSDLTSVNADAADDVLGVVDPPYLTGRLASTVDAVVDALGFTLTAGGPAAPYGPIVHARDPFLTRALNARETAVIDQYEQHIDKSLDTIQGA